MVSSINFMQCDKLSFFFKKKDISANKICLYAALPFLEETLGVPEFSDLVTRKRISVKSILKS